MFIHLFGRKLLIMLPFVFLFLVLIHSVISIWYYSVLLLKLKLNFIFIYFFLFSNEISSLPWPDEPGFCHYRTHYAKEKRSEILAETHQQNSCIRLVPL